MYDRKFNSTNLFLAERTDLFCKFCNKSCKNLNSLKQHEVRCKDNPERIAIVVPKNTTKGRIPWNKGLTKESDLRVKNASVSLSKSIKGRPGHPQSDETKQKLREVAIRNGLGGFNMRNKGILYKNVKLDSSFELAVAKELDANDIKWQRCPRFLYVDLNGVEHTYTPDFYLPDFDVYIDPKNDYLINNINPSLGYSDLDKIKWVMEQNKIRVLILNSTQLTWEYIKACI